MTRIYIISRHSLFGDGIEDLLRKEPALEIVGREQDIGKAMEQIDDLQPDVVILDCHEDRQAVQPLIMKILQGGVPARVISMDLQTNTIVVHKREQHDVHGMEDLIAAIEGSAASSSTVKGETETWRKRERGENGSPASR